MNAITVTGMVLSAATIGETDRRVVILTREQGRISAFARGACRPKSPLVAAARPFVTGEFVLVPRRDSYTLQSAAVKEYFDALTKDFDRMTYGCYFLELAGYFSVEQSDETELLNLLYLTLKALEKGQMSGTLIRMVYEYRLFVVSGEYPQVFTCCRCGQPLKEGWFSMGDRGAVCKSCGTGAGDVYLSSSAVYALQYILTSPVNRLYSFRLSDEVFAVLSCLLNKWKKRFLDRKFRSEELLQLPKTGETSEM